jgi:hypothetical protein
MTARGKLETVGRYRVLDTLGVGGFATVYRAHDPALDREVALKVLHPQYSNDATTRTRFIREGYALARVRHPNVVHVYDAGEADGDVYLAMELIQGQSLQEILTTRGPLPLREAAGYAEQIAGGLEAIHAASLIHRDVKPANVMVETGTSRCVLLDLGSVHMASATVLTVSQTFFGTPGFMAPEQIEPEGQVSVQTDVYQFGAMLYTFLTGQPPFSGDPSRVLYAVVHSSPPDPRAQRQALPASISSLVQRAMAKNPAKRPRSVRTVADGLRQALEDARPSPAVSEAATVPHAVSVRGVAARPHRPTPHRRRRSPALIVLPAGLLAGAALGLAVVWLSRDDDGGRLAVIPAPTLAATPPAAAPTANTTVAVTASAAPATATAAIVTPTPSPTIVRTATPTPAPSRTPTQAPSPTAAAAAPADIPTVGGQWVFTDTIQYGAGTGSAYTFRVRLQQDGARVTGTGDLALEGVLEGSTLRATFRQGSGTGEFLWTFNGDGTAFTGTFNSTWAGNGGDSTGSRVGP